MFFSGVDFTSLVLWRSVVAVYRVFSTVSACTHSKCNNVAVGNFRSQQNFHHASCGHTQSFCIQCCEIIVHIVWRVDLYRSVIKINGVNWLERPLVNMSE